MKLNLNQPAMEWLWNQLSEDVQIELSTNVIQSFARHHLKGVINSDLYQNLLKFVTEEINKYKVALHQEIETKFADSFGTITRDKFSGKITHVKLFPDIIDEIKSYVRSHRYEIMKEAIEERLKVIEPEFDLLIQDYVDIHVKELVREKVNKIVKSL